MYIHSYSNAYEEKQIIALDIQHHEFRHTQHR